MARRLAQLAAVALFTGIAWRSAAASAITMPTVERVQVVVESASPIPVQLRTRIEMSVAKVAERIISGRPVDGIQEQRAECERVIADIFRRLLSGFNLDELTLIVAPEARIMVRLTPEAPLVGRVDLAFEAPGLPQEALNLVEREIWTHQGDFGRIFMGVPIKALAWAQPTLTAVLEEDLGEYFPGFRQEVTVNAGETLEVRVRMTPAQPRVEQVLVEVSSHTLPQVLIGLWRERISGHFGALKGLPIAYLRRHQLLLENQSAERLAQDGALDHLGLKWQVKLNPGPVTQAKLQVEAGHYSLIGLASLEITDPPVFGLSLRTGVRPLAEWELAGEMALETGGRGFDFLVSLVYLKSAEMSLGFTYGLRDEERLVWLRYTSGRGDLLVLGGDLKTNSVTATIGLTVESQFIVTLTVDSSRNYSLLVQVGL